MVSNKTNPFEVDVTRNVSADARRGLTCAEWTRCPRQRGHDCWRIEHAVSSPFMARTPVSGGPLSILAKRTTLRNQKRPTSFSFTRTSINSASALLDSFETLCRLTVVAVALEPGF